MATDLFNKHGVRAVGMQQLVDETGVGKSLVYREFAGKDDLVVAWLHQMRAAWWDMSANVTLHYPDDPARQLLGIVEMVYEQVAAEGYFGCVYHTTSSEFRDPQHPGHQESVRHAREIREQLRGLAAAAGVVDPHRLADELLLIIDGIYASGSVLGPSGPSRTGVELATRLIQQHCPGGLTATTRH
ncbi:TetR/AcrR family transcriptional regulator [Kribbella sp. VKM Ac-2566]|uniref:TetR/AcrR family transcriptional regulator n=1 Tax=Kribbella sp. VKM Ac-2566 TaxID=2512218 RepID=UPI0014170E8C|nr:TetR/AcrR family transcriptional regulator [Kribbella sp. VKM Ac-2566]